jgi:hypothetical protein
MELDIQAFESNAKEIGVFSMVNEGTLEVFV